jgi:hypothetical protein
MPTEVYAWQNGEGPLLGATGSYIVKAPHFFGILNHCRMDFLFLSIVYSAPRTFPPTSIAASFDPKRKFHDGILLGELVFVDLRAGKGAGLSLALRLLRGDFSVAVENLKLWGIFQSAESRRQTLRHCPANKQFAAYS